MSTGTSKSKWENGSQIISKEKANTHRNSYEIVYEGKRPAEDILKKKLTTEFVQLYNSSGVELSLSNLLFYGDNIEVLQYLIHNVHLKGKVSLIYIDPPYGTNSIFLSRNNTDSYKDDLIGSHYLEFIRQRLILMRELLSEAGSIYVHLDNNMAFQVKIIMDEIFGPKNFRAFITRKKCSNKNYTKNTYGNISDYILFYSKTSNYTWNRPTESWTDEKVLKEYTNIEVDTGRRFKKVPIHAPGIRNGETGKEWKGMLPPTGKHWQFTPNKLDEFDNKGEIYWSSNGNPRRKVYLDTSDGIAVQDIWLDLQDSLNQNIKITGYPTEKNPFLLEQIIKASSNENDIVLDCFAGSGTTLGVANQLNRKWIGVDNSSEAINHIFKRFVDGVKEMGDYVVKQEKGNTLMQQTLFESLVGYNTEIKGNYRFSFVSDNEHLTQAEELLAKWFGTIGSSQVAEDNVSYHEELSHAVKIIKQRDKHLKKIIEEIGACQISPRQSKFDYLVEAIISQQLSLAASETILKRVRGYFKGKMSADKILKTPHAELKELGISARKLTYIIDLCEKISASQLSLSDLDKGSNEEIILQLTKVKGIGSWTSKMFLIFVLGRLNVFPSEDTAFINQLKKIYKLNGNGSLASELDIIQKAWAPHETIGAWYIWKSISRSK